MFWRSSEEWCMAVSGWFGLCSVGGRAPAQIKDFSVKVPDSATVIYAHVCLCTRLCVCVCDSGGSPSPSPSPSPSSFNFFFLTSH